MKADMKIQISKRTREGGPECRGNGMKEFQGASAEARPGKDGVEGKQKKNSHTFSSLGGLDWDLARMFPAPPLPEEKTSVSGWGRRTWGSG